MAVAQTDAERFGALDRAVEILDEDIVVAGRLHLGKGDLAAPLPQPVDIDKFCVRLAVAAGDDVGKRVCRVERGQTGDRKLQRLAVQRDIVLHRRVHQGAGVDDITDPAALKQFPNVIALPDAGDLCHVDAERGNGRRRLLGGKKLEAEVVQFFGKRDDFGLIVRVHAEQNADVLVQKRGSQQKSRGGQPLEERLLDALADAEHLARRFHFGSEIRIGVAQFFKREDRHFDGKIGRRAVEPRPVAEIGKLCPCHHGGGKVDHRHARDLADVRHSARSARIDLDDVEFAPVDEILDIDKPFGAEREGEPRRAVDDPLHHFVVDAVGRIDGDRVAAMDARAFDMLHHARDEHVAAVRNDVDFEFLARHVFVDQHGVLDPLRQDALHINAHFVFVVDDLHILSADDVGGAKKDGIAERFCRGERLAKRLDAHAARALDVEFFEEAVKAFSVLRDVDPLGGGAEDRDPLPVEEFGEFDRGLPAERHDDADRLFDLDDIHDVLGAKRLEIQPVRRIVVGRNGLGIVVDDDDVIAALFERPDAVDRGIVKFDPLPDADRSRAEHQDDRLARARKAARLAGLVVGRIEIGGHGVELGAAGVDHFIDSVDRREFVRARQAGERRVGIAVPLARKIEFFVKPAGDPPLISRKICKLAEEKAVDLSDLVDLFHRDPASERLEHRKDAAVVGRRKPRADIGVRERLCV